MSELTNLSTEELLQKRKEGVASLPGYRGEVPSKSALRKLPNVQPGEIFWITNDYYSVVVSKVENSRIELKALDENATLSSGLTLYDMNKKGVEKEPLFDWTDKDKVKELKQTFLDFFKSYLDEHFLLYGRNINYFSIFTLAEFKVEFEMDTIKETIDNIGNLVSVHKEQRSLEIWIKDSNNEPQLLYLFPCDSAFIRL